MIVRDDNGNIYNLIPLALPSRDEDEEEPFPWKQACKAISCLACAMFLLTALLYAIGRGIAYIAYHMTLLF